MLIALIIQTLSLNLWSMDQFYGTVSLQGCSGALVTVHGRSMDQKAWVLTNGHCILELKKFALTSIPIPRTQFMALLHKNQNETFAIYIQKLIYSTIKKTDIALYQLDESYTQIYQRTGVMPLVISQSEAQEGESFILVSAFWRNDRRCQVDGIVHQLQEGPGVFKRSVRYIHCETKGGQSGSPLISELSGEVIAIHNSFNRDGQLCRLQNPCEINEQGDKNAVHRAAYGQQVAWIYNCLDENFEWSLNERNCKLPESLTPLLH